MLRQMSVPSWETLRPELEATSEADANLKLTGSVEEEEEEVLVYPESPAKRPILDITPKQDLSVGNPESVGASTWQHGSAEKCTQQLRDALEHVMGLFIYFI